MKMQAKYCIVGSGVVGGTVAEQLLAQGERDVLLLEAGRKMVMRDERRWLDAVVSKKVEYADGLDAASDYELTGDQPFAGSGSRLWAGGGTTLHWTGVAPRMREEDFERASRTGLGVDWPFSYDVLEPYLCRAESTLQVAGESAEARDEPRRSAPYPLPPFPFTLDDRRFVEALAKLGYSVGPIPIARNSRATNGMPACSTFGTCEYCPIGGRFTGDQILDRLQMQSGFRLLLRHTVVRLEADRGRRVVRLHARDLASGEAVEVEAHRFVLCAGAIETPKLLLASQQPGALEGLGNQRQQVGRHLAMHLMAGSLGVVPGNEERVAREVNWPTAGSRHFDGPANQRSGKFSFGSWPPFFPFAEHMAKGEDAAGIAKKLSAHFTYNLIANTDSGVGDESFVALASGTNAWGAPRTRIHLVKDRFLEETIRAASTTMRKVLETMGASHVGDWAAAHDAHVLGTARMSRSPDTGVVDSDLKVHELENLFLCGNAVLPTTGTANPTLISTALAHRLADHLARA